MEQIQYINELPQLGYLCKAIIFIAFISAIFSGVSYLISTKNNDDVSWQRLGKIGFYIHGVSIFLLLTTIFYAMVTHRYEYSYVYDHVSDDLPMRYILSAFWEGQEGSFLLWMFWHIIIGFILIKTSKQYQATVLMVIAFAEVWLTSMILGIYLGYGDHLYKIGSNPMTLIRDINAAPIFNNADYLSLIKGRGLNPLLQNYWMTIHPPFVFLGFAMSIVPFAYAVAALIKKDFISWLKPVNKWALVGTAILGISILMGSLWAYEALSFGGYWAWDPVENTSLVPWIFLVAGIHTNLIANATGRAIKMTFVFYLLSFLMVLYSTLLTRSGILGDTSAHAFTEMGLEWQLTIFLLFFSIVGFSLLLWRNKDIPHVEKEEAAHSKEFWMYVGALVLLFSGLLINGSSSLPVFNTIMQYFDESYVGRVIKDPVEHYNKFQLWIAVFVGLLSGYAIWLQYKPLVVLKRNFYIKLAIHLVLAMALAIVTNLIIKLPQWPHWIMTIASWFTITSNIEYFYNNISKNKKAFSSAIAHAGFGFMCIGILATGLNHQYISNPFVFKGLFSEMGAEEKYIQLIKKEPLLVKDYLIEYKSDTLIARARYYDLLFKKLDKKNGQVIDSFMTRPNAVYANDFSKIAAFNPDTRHYIGKDIFTCIVQLPPSVADVEIAKQTEDSIKYNAYNVNVGDSIKLKKSTLIINGYTSSPTHIEYLKNKHDIGYEVNYTILGDHNEKGVAAIGLSENVIYKYAGIHQNCGLKIRPQEAFLEQFVANESNLKYEAYSFKEGETKQIGSCKITLKGFDKNVKNKNYASQEGDLAVAAILDVEFKGIHYESKPVFIIRGNMPMSIKDYIPELELHTRLSNIDPIKKTFEIKAAKSIKKDQKIHIEIAEDVPRNDYIILEAKIFPGINFFWIGSILMFAGLLYAWIVKKKE